MVGGFGAGERFFVARFLPDGTFDASFGIASGGNFESINALAIDATDRIVAARSGRGGQGQDFRLLRLTADGKPDTSFNGSGEQVIRVGEDNTFANAVAIGNGQIGPLGLIAIAGQSRVGGRSAFKIALVLPDGSIDSSFGTNGVVSTTFDNNENNEAEGVLFFDSSDRLVAAGITVVPTTQSVAIVRYLLH